MRRYTMVPCLSIFASGRGAVGSFWRYWWFPFAIDLLLTGIGRLSGCRHGLWLLPFTVRRLFGGACISQSSSSSSHLTDGGQTWNGALLHPCVLEVVP